jgi:hypothetical protein
MDSLMAFHWTNSNNFKRTVCHLRRQNISYASVSLLWRDVCTEGVTRRNLISDGERESEKMRKLQPNEQFSCSASTFWRQTFRRHLQHSTSRK